MFDFIRKYYYDCVICVNSTVQRAKCPACSGWLKSAEGSNDSEMLTCCCAQISGATGSHNLHVCDPLNNLCENLYHTSDGCASGFYNGSCLFSCLHWTLTLAASQKGCVSSQDPSSSPHFTTGCSCFITFAFHYISRSYVYLIA